MSWDIEIVDDNDKLMQCSTKHQMRGGTIRVDRDMNQVAVADAELNITYNYSAQYTKVWDDYSGLYDRFNDKKASECISDLALAVEMLGTETDDDYWVATSGNAGKAAEDFLWLCQQCPDGTVKIC